MLRKKTRTSKRSQAFAALSQSHDIRYNSLPNETSEFRDRIVNLHSNMISRGSGMNKSKGASPASKAKEHPLALIGLALPAQSLQLPAPQTCHHCHAKKFAFESLHFCCDNGDIKIATNEYPPVLQHFFTSNEKECKEFRTYARLYNNVFAFSSLGGCVQAGSQKGIYVFKLQGQLYHFVPDLIPTEGKPKYLQLYFYERAHEVGNRTSTFKEVKQEIVAKLMQVTEINPYAHFFRSLGEIEVTENTTIVLNKNTVPDQRVYNAPCTDEVAAIWPDNTAPAGTSSPHILVFGKSNEPHRIEHYYGCYDPLQYPLLFPYGDCGWHQGLKKLSFRGRQQSTTQVDPVESAAVHSIEDLISEEDSRSKQRNTKASKFISPREYYAYKLQIRPNNLLLRAGRCFQQYIVDMYVKVENTRLDFFRRNQDTIRAELYQGVLDSFEAGESAAANIERRVILPATYIGGPRDMKRRYFNAMALVQKYGKPDLFVTMTCNANWPKIKAELAAGEKPQDRPDVVARIFRAKLLALKDQIMKKKCFGEVAAMIYVVEFQKRGLPHAHFLLVLQPEYKLKAPAEYDKFVCAEIPSPSDALLRNIVISHMMHGPCGDKNPDCACMRKQGNRLACKNKYPKNYADETTTNEDGYPLYRRTNTGETVRVRGHDLDNRWVVPYNPYLSVLFDCHVNVEVCSTIKAVKYLYKYVYKGHDKIQYSVVNDSTAALDEIDQYQSGRWVSPCEAAWRIFSFDLFDMHPPVLPLPVHLPNMQSIRLHTHESLRSVLNDQARKKTPLIEFFAANEAKEGGTGYLYSEFCEHYRWDAASKSWFLRQNKRIQIGRLAFAFPAEGERFYLRLLLLHVRSPTSFEHLKTVNGRVCSTFQEAALELGLLEQDNVAELCLVEAAATQHPSAFRRLFAVILIFTQPNDPSSLWVRFYDQLAEDHTYQYPHNPNKARNMTIRSLEQHIESMGRTLKSVGLPELQSQTDAEFHRTKDIIDALDAPIPDDCVQCKNKLNSAQSEAFSIIMQHVYQNQTGAFFIDGPGGTGKTFLYKALYAEIRLMNKIVLPTATSGIAAANIPSGRTAHSRFKIPISLEHSAICNVSKQSSLAALLRETTLIIWDEASMAHKETIECLDSLLRDLCDPKLIFGGKLVVFGGDFRQVLPIVPHKSQRQAVEASIVSSYLWPQLQKLKLTENQRAKEDPEFSQYLLALGNGQLQSTESAYVTVPSQVMKVIDPDEEPIEAIIEHAFPEITSSSFTPEVFCQRAILTPMNDTVDATNTTLIAKFPGKEVVYKSFDSILSDTCDVYPTEFLNKLCPGGMSPHELVLKLDCPVILLRNLLPSAGLCNGTRLICKAFFRNVIQCEICVGQLKGENVFIPRINLRPSESSNYPFQFERKQFPLKLSFAMTINKSQGQTLDRVCVMLPQPCFSHGQLYVTLSRGRKKQNVTVFAPTPPKPMPVESVKNIVSYDILRLAGL